MAAVTAETVLNPFLPAGKTPQPAPGPAEIRSEAMDVTPEHSGGDYRSPGQHLLACPSRPDPASLRAAERRFLTVSRRAGGGHASGPQLCPPPSHLYRGHRARASTACVSTCSTTGRRPRAPRQERGWCIQMASNNANVIAFPDLPPKGSRSNGGKSALMGPELGTLVWL